MDRGANGGIVGSDARVIYKYDREVDVTGIDNHEIGGLHIVHAAAKMMSHLGPIIIMMRQYAMHGRNRTIHSCGQLEHYKNIVEDRGLKCGGKQCVKLHEGYVLPLDIVNGLPYLKMSPHTDKEWEELPHVFLTSSDIWDPRVLDCTISDQDDWYNNIRDLEEELIKTPFDEKGNYRHRQPPKYVEEPIQVETVDDDNEDDEDYVDSEDEDKELIVDYPIDDPD